MDGGTGQLAANPSDRLNWNGLPNPSENQSDPNSRRERPSLLRSCLAERLHLHRERCLSLRGTASAKHKLRGEPPKALKSARSSLFVRLTKGLSEASCAMYLASTKVSNVCQSDRC